MTNPIDLHIHTIASDGSDSPAELLKKLCDAGVHTFSVTDHDTIDGALAMERIVPAGMRYIRGIEFSCTSPGGNCHILGYGYDPEDSVFRDALAYGTNLRLRKLARRLTFLEEQFAITLTDAEAQWLQSQRSPGKPHLGRILVNRGLAPNIDTALKHYLNLQKGNNDRISAEMAVHAIRHAGGIPVWAHPLGGEGERHLSREEFENLLSVLMGYGIRGLECHYSRYTAQETVFLTEQANRHGLLISGGSDFHGTNKANLHLGKLNADSHLIEPGLLTLLEAL